MTHMLSIGRHPEKQPVILYLEGRTLIIDCLFRFNRRALRVKPDPERDETYADLITSGITDNWRSSHPANDLLPDFFERDQADPDAQVRQAITDDPDALLVQADQPDPDQPTDSVAASEAASAAEGRLNIEVRIKRIDAQQRRLQIMTAFHGSWRQGLATWLARRRSVKIDVRPMFFMPAHVISPLHRRIWGILRTGQIESLGLNWSPRHPGRIVIPPYRQVWMIKSVAAHEAGHVFGIGDAYAAIYRFYHEAPDTHGYMMNNNQQVHADEIRMLLKAQRTGRMQFFPKKWLTRPFFAGLAGDIRQRSRQVKANMSDSRQARLSINERKKNQRRNLSR